MYNEENIQDGELRAPDLSKYGIQAVKQIFYNLSYDELFEHETNPSIEGFERGYLTNLGAVTVDTGIFTGRSPKDKYVVKEETSRDNIWWSDDTNKSDNHAISEETWQELKLTTLNQFHEKKLYVMDAFCGANENTRIKIRVITEVAWMAHFVKNMFIRPTEEELKDFEPDFIMLNACKTLNENWEKQDLNSDVYIAFNLKEKLALVGGTWYGGEIKKGFFSIMNYILPLQGIASMHCSANMGKNGDTAIFFGLSGTGKTTLSTDPERYLIGDDEHGWDDEGIFNLEGGCYAKCINLSKDKEPDIFNAIKRDALLENVVIDEKTGEINFFDTTKTENTRVSYPIYHIENIVKPVSKGTHPKNVIFLTADAFGVFPPVARLNLDQAMYYFLSGYTAKLAGTERGVKEPVLAFSPAFGAAFLSLHPTVYARELAKKMRKHGTKAFLVNTGWVGGAYGVGNRIDIETTRRIIKAILNGELDNVDLEELAPFGLNIPKHIEGIDPEILNPKNSWKSESAYFKQADMLAEKFIENFNNFTDTEEGQRLVAAGPQNKFMKQYYRYYEVKLKKMEWQHSREISRLKDQIYILQNSFNEYISFNSINSGYKNKPLLRHIPVIAWFDTDSDSDMVNCHNAVIKLMKTAGFDSTSMEETPFGYNEFITKSRKDLTLPEVYNIILDIASCFENGRCINDEFIHAKTDLIDVSFNVKQFVIKLGNLLIVKKQEDEESYRIIVKRLPVSALIHLDKNPHLLTKPVELIDELYYF